MIVVKAPFRISLFGGGTDFPDFFNQYTGYTLSFAINKYCYIQMRELKQYQNKRKYEIITHKMEATDNINEISNPVIRECLRKYRIENARVVYDADLPSKSGLGTSSALAVAMIKACRIYTHKGNENDVISIIKEAIDLERNVLKEAGGYQDQIISALGGFKLVKYYKNNEFKILKDISTKKRKFIKNLMLFDTGINRYSFEIQKDVLNNIESNYNKLSRIKLLTDKAYTSIHCSPDDNKIEIGKLLDSTWENKKKLSDKITNNKIDVMYKIAKENGAIGGKILGAGGGGYLLLYVLEENKDKVREALKGYDEILFNVSNVGVEEVKYAKYNRNR